jgi:DNA-binding CsgD family transcriptional regulator
MIVSRAAELGRLEELLDGLRAGTGSALLVRGDPGIGKTTLLDALVDRCGDGVTVLRARGVETEAELAFSALSDLLAPVIDSLTALPAPQSAALAAALALGPPTPGDRLAVCVATLGLLRAAAATRPVVAVVDDVQWLDASSRECISYAARRAGGPIVIALAVRDPWDALEQAGLPELQLEPVDNDASLTLLRRTAPDLAPSVAKTIAEAAAGNPLALVELPGALTGDQRAGIAALELPLAPGARLHDALARRIDELDPLVRSALVVAAAHVGDDLAAISAACGDAQTDVGWLAQAEARGLVRIGSAHLRFAHPLIRGAVYQEATAAERRRAHRALAGVLDGEQRAWHLAAAAIGPDESVAVELEQVAAGAAARRAFAPASTALERAARLSPAPEAVARRLLAAGQAAGAAGTPDRAIALLEESSSVATDEVQRARGQHLRGLMLIWSGKVEQGTALLVSEAERAARHDPVLAGQMLAGAANGFTASTAYHRAEALAERAAALLGDGGDPTARAHVLATQGWILVLRGKTRRARGVLTEAEGLAEGLDPLGPQWAGLHLILRARVPLGELERALTESVAVCARAREAGALATLGGALIIAADAGFRLGDWDVTDATTSEAIRVAGDTGQSIWLGYALTFRARLAAARGNEQESRDAALAAQRLAESEHIGSGRRFVHGALGFLELSLGRIDEAIAELEIVERILEGSGLEEPTTVPFAPDLVEAYVRGGRVGDAQRVLATLERQATLTGSTFAGAATARCRGMLEDDFDPAFAEALRLHDRCPMPFERARTVLAFGQQLHRARRRAEARERLREAQAGFVQLRAAAWVAQAENELRAAGARRRTARSNELTPQELRVATAVGRGASNREIAAELFLAPKTIEFHLRQIYRKLGIRSRTQLVATLARNAEIDS